MTRVRAIHLRYGAKTPSASDADGLAVSLARRAICKTPCAVSRLVGAQCTPDLPHTCQRGRYCTASAKCAVSIRCAKPPGRGRAGQVVTGIVDGAELADLARAHTCACAEPQARCRFVGVGQQVLGAVIDRNKPSPLALARGLDPRLA